MEENNKPETTEIKDISQYDDQSETDKEQNSDDPYRDMIFPSLVTRVKALMIDLVVILCIFSLASLIIDKFDQTPIFVRVLIFIFCIYLYEPLLITLYGGTIGHHLVKIGIRKVNHPEKKINLLQASVRFITKYIFGWLSFITVTFNRRKRAIHDMVSRSIVLYKSN